MATVVKAKMPGQGSTQALRPTSIPKSLVVKDFQKIRRGVHAEAARC